MCVVVLLPRGKALSSTPTLEFFCNGPNRAVSEPKSICRVSLLVARHLHSSPLSICK